MQQTSTVNGGASTTSYLLDQVTNVAAISVNGGAPASLLTGIKPDSHFATVSAAGQVAGLLLSPTDGNGP